MPNFLFICSRNQWRSRTAETIFRGRQGMTVRSAGTAPGARIRVTAGLLSWADHIFVMETKHRDYLSRKFPDQLSGAHLEVLHIPDEYRYMDEELVAELEDIMREWM